jgi:hypothetical protein
MCDYSLNAAAFRPAKVGDRLVTARFTNCITRGLASIEEPEVAVCLRPGTEVAFEQDVGYEHPLGFFPERRINNKVARFCQVNMHEACAHHDALEFPDDRIVLVTYLSEGQRLTVLQLPARHRSGEAEEEKRVSTTTA